MKKLKTISEQVYDYIIEKITNGEFQPGQRLTEADLLQELDISRTPVRDAFLQLASDGVLVSVPRKGYFIKEYDEETANEDWQIIARLDAYAAELAVNNLTNEDYDEMQSCIEQMDSAISGNDIAAYNSLQHKFHDIYLNKCGSKRLIEELHSLLHGVSRASAFLSLMEGVQESTKTINESHKNLLELFKQKDLKPLTDAIIDHWTNSSYGIVA